VGADTVKGRRKSKGTIRIHDEGERNKQEESDRSDSAAAVRIIIHADEKWNELRSAEI
jgi:hypothetical protein